MRAMIASLGPREFTRKRGNTGVHVSCLLETHASIRAIRIPEESRPPALRIGNRTVALTNLDKPFWRKLGLTKRDSATILCISCPVLLPHLRDRAMVMKRYPDGADGECFL